MLLSRRTVVVVTAAVGLTACGDGTDAAGPAASRAPSAIASARPSPTGAPALDRPTTVPANANIFGAGRSIPPAPGGGGAGTLPPRFKLPSGPHRIVTFGPVGGRVTPIVDEAGENGPAGDGIGATDVRSHGGISGIIDQGNGMFLVGVFLTDRRPAGKAPPRLDFTNHERFRSLAPRMAQTFYIGDGKGRTYRVPAGATRLHLGFADGFRYQGAPGWYGNNDGELTVTVHLGRPAR